MTQKLGRHSIPVRTVRTARTFRNAALAALAAAPQPGSRRDDQEAPPTPHSE